MQREIRCISDLHLILIASKRTEIFFFCSLKERQFLAGKHYYLLLIFRISLAAITVAFVSQTSYLVGNGHGAWKMRKVREKKKSNEKKG